MKASQGSCREEAGPLRGQRAGEAAAWHPLHALCVPTASSMGSSACFGMAHTNLEPEIRGGGVYPPCTSVELPQGLSQPSAGQELQDSPR